jgi:hypothetical protein
MRYRRRCSARSRLDRGQRYSVTIKVTMAECGVLCLKSALRLERRGEQGQEEAEQRDHHH